MPYLVPRLPGTAGQKLYAKPCGAELCLAFTSRYPGTSSPSRQSWPRRDGCPSRAPPARSHPRKVGARPAFGGRRPRTCGRGGSPLAGIVAGDGCRGTALAGDAERVPIPAASALLPARALGAGCCLSAAPLGSRSLRSPAPAHRHRPAPCGALTRMELLHGPEAAESVLTCRKHFPVTLPSTAQ